MYKYTSKCSRNIPEFFRAMKNAIRTLKSLPNIFRWKSNFLKNITFPWWLFGSMVWYRRIKRYSAVLCRRMTPSSPLTPKFFKEFYSWFHLVYCAWKLWRQSFMTFPMKVHEGNLASFEFPRGVFRTEFLLVPRLFALYSPAKAPIQHPRYCRPRNKTVSMTIFAKMSQWLCILT